MLITQVQMDMRAGLGYAHLIASNILPAWRKAPCKRHVNHACGALDYKTAVHAAILDHKAFRID